MYAKLCVDPDLGGGSNEIEICALGLGAFGGYKSRADKKLAISTGETKSTKQVCLGASSTAEKTT